MKLGMLARVEAIPALVAVALSLVVPMLAWPTSIRSNGARAFTWWLVLGGTFNVISLITSVLSINNHDFLQWYRLFSVSLLLLVGYHLVPTRISRRSMMIGSLLFAGFWTAMTLGLDTLSYYSRYTAPVESSVRLALGIWLVVWTVRNRNELPTQLAAIWIGVGLAVGGGATVVAFPVIGQVVPKSQQTALLLSEVSAFTDIAALLLWLVPFRKRGIVWQG